MIDNLGDENFFNAVQQLCPDAIDHFIKWFDEYKREVGWDALFGNGLKIMSAKESARFPNHHISFTDIPFEMQNGIIARYELELFNNAQGRGKETYVMIAKQYHGQIRSLFAEVQKRIILLRQGSRG